eukprot:222712_1
MQKKIIKMNQTLALVCVLIVLYLLSEVDISNTYNQINNPFHLNDTMSIESKSIESHQSASKSIKKKPNCLNEIYDAIFLISIPIRYETLSITLAQLIAENIDFILWQGHSPNNPSSIDLWNMYRNSWQNVPTKGRDQNSAYNESKIFFLRQTDMDIFHYSLKNNFSKILILEDDILFADTNWFKLFCKIEPHLPEWYVLNLGINNVLYDKYQFNQSDFFLHNTNFFQLHKNVTNFENSKMKYYQTPYNAFGAFAISFSYKMYQIMLDIYDMDSKSEMRSDFPMDSYQEILPVSPYNMHINDKFLSIDPTLFLPDVTKSMLRNGRVSMEEYIKTRTSDNDNSRFQKYWKLRFSDKPLVFESSPSQAYLRNNRLLHSR